MSKEKHKKSCQYDSKPDFLLCEHAVYIIQLLIYKKNQRTCMMRNLNSAYLYNWLMQITEFKSWKL